MKINPDYNYNDQVITNGDSIFQPEEVFDIELDEVISMIQEDEDLKNDIEEIRSMMKTNPDCANKLKNYLPWFSVCRFNGKRDGNNFSSTNLMLFDIDDIDENEDVVTDKIIELEGWEHCFIIFRSPSGRGIKLIVKLDEEITSADDYKSIYIAILSIIEEKFQITLDRSTCDPARACFFSYDESIGVIEEALPINVDDLRKKQIIAEVKEPKPRTKREQMIENIRGVPQGQRHNAMLQTISMLKRKGLDNSMIKEISYSINKNNFPKLTDQEYEDEYASIMAYLNKKMDESPKFWKVKHDNENVTITINMLNFIKFLKYHGYCKYRLSDDNYFFIRIQNNIIKAVSIVEIKDFVSTYFEISEIEFKEAVLNQLIRQNKSFFSNETLHFLPEEKPAIIRSDKQSEFFFFLNCYVEITKEKITAHNYSDLGEMCVWQDDIIQRIFDVKTLEDNYMDSVFNMFTINICRKEDEWHKALRCAIGYSCHGYKDPANAKTIIFCDEEIPYSDEANGGTGKSLVSLGIRHCKPGVVIDGKNFHSESQFNFQQVSPNTKIIIFDDVRQNFDFETLLSAVSSDLTVQRKHQTPFTIPFKESPKFIITTNYTISGEGNTYDRRKYEVEFSNYYNKDNTPDVEFGHRFFDDWDDVEWNRFFMTIMKYIQDYLNFGLVKYEQKNLPVRKILDQTCQEFLDFAEDKIELNKEYDRSSLFELFKSQYSDFVILHSRTFYKWLKIYAVNMGLQFNDRKSNGKRFISFSKDNKLSLAPETLNCTAPHC